MPLYDYKCNACDITIEKMHKISESPKYQCPKCQKTLFRVLGGAGLTFNLKGDGWFNGGSGK